MTRMESNQSPSLEEFMEKMSLAWVEEDKKKISELELLLRDLNRDDAVAVFCGLSTVGSLQSKI